MAEAAGEALQSTDAGPGAIDSVDLALPIASLLRGYCAECGTWDDHGSKCKTCGYAFTGAPIWVDPEFE